MILKHSITIQTEDKAMSVRKYKSNPVELLEKGKEIMSHSDGSKFYRKVAAVNLVLSGTPAANVAAANGLCRATVSGWVKKVDEQGFDALWEVPRKGRISKLSQEQYCELESIIQQDPHKFGYNLWDGNTLGDLILKKYGVSFKIRHCQTIFHKLGFSRVRPQTFPSKNEEHSVEREAFKKKWLKSEPTRI